MIQYCCKDCGCSAVDNAGSRSKLLLLVVGGGTAAAAAAGGTEAVPVGFLSCKLLVCRSGGALH